MKRLAILLALLLSTLAFGGEKVIYSFKGGNDGWNPLNGGLVMDSAGNLYGTTFKGGTSSAGTIFQLSPNGSGGWTETVLYSFAAAVDSPSGQIVADGSGNLFGCTLAGGAFGGGSVFELSPAEETWTFSVLHSFHGFDGTAPRSGIAMDAVGNLYGATYSGGSNNGGTVFRLSNIAGKWRPRTLHSFGGGNDGVAPLGAIAVDAHGTVYGTSGGREYGVIYRVGMSNGKWTEKVIYAFQGGKDGFDPQYGIFLASGSLYGTIPSDSGGDIVYRLAFTDGSWNKKTIYTFTHRNKGHSEGGLVFDPAGKVYGTTAFGGLGFGSVFRLSPVVGKYSYSYTLLRAFQGGSDGDGPTGQLVMDEKTGILYGTTAIGGGGSCSSSGCGTVFEITP